ncbi:iron-sulfur cluster assembly protein SufB [Nonlabens ulvanivorans]|nr:iron-sulfur cluster assembly protein SufB [Nonlabens ulvanivorans]
MGNECGAHTFPYIENSNSTSKVEHEATTSKIGEDRFFTVTSVVLIQKKQLH